MGSSQKLRWILAFFAAVLVAVAGVHFCRPKPKPEGLAPRVRRSFSSAGINKVILRAADAADVWITAKPIGETIDISGVPIGGAPGYHPPGRSWSETPPAEWGLDFVTARHGDVLIISTTHEMHYIHHAYRLRWLSLDIPPGIGVVREPKASDGNQEPDLSAPH